MSDYTARYVGVGSLRLRDGSVVSDVRYSVHEGAEENTGRCRGGEDVTLAPDDPHLAWRWSAQPEGATGMTLQRQDGPELALLFVEADLRAGVVRARVLAELS
jgi:hypothetical protein